MPKENTLNLNSLKEEKKETLNLGSLKNELPSKTSNEVFKPLTQPQRKLKVEVKELKNSSAKHRKNYFTILKSRNFIIALVFLLITTIGLFILQREYGSGESFYVGQWSLELTDKEKTEGIQNFKYSFTKDRINQEINLDTQGLKAKVNLSSGFLVKESSHSKTIMERTNQKIDSIDVQVPEILCEQGGGCEAVKERFISKFNEEFQKGTKLNPQIIITKLSKEKIRLESNQEGDIILKKE